MVCFFSKYDFQITKKIVKNRLTNNNSEWLKKLSTTTITPLHHVYFSKYNSYRFTIVSFNIDIIINYIRYIFSTLVLQSSTAYIKAIDFVERIWRKKEKEARESPWDWNNSYVWVGEMIENVIIIKNDCIFPF